MLGDAVGTQQIDEAGRGVGESGTADRALDGAFPKESSSETVIVQSRDGVLTARDPAFRSAVADVVRRVSAFDTVTRVRSPFAAGNAGQVSQDGRSAPVQFDVPGADHVVEERIVPIEEVMRATEAGHPALRIEQFGDASANKAISDQVEQDFHRQGRRRPPPSDDPTPTAMRAIRRRT